MKDMPGTVRETPSLRHETAFWQVFSIGVLYHFIYCILASQVLVSYPLIGGSLYLFGHMTVMFTQMHRPPRNRVLSRKENALTWGLLLLPVLLLPFVNTLFPVELESPQLWVLMGIALLLTVRRTLTGYLIEKDLIQKLTPTKAFTRSVALQALFVVPVLALLPLPDTSSSLALVLGYIVGGIIEIQEFWRERRALQAHGEEDLEELKTLRHVPAYKRFQDVLLIIAAALQVTMAFTNAVIAALTGASVWAMMAVVALTAVCSLLTDLILKRIVRERTDPGNLLIVGISLWLYGLIRFIPVFEAADLSEAYLSLALCTSGGAVCTCTLGYMDKRMRDVASFALHREPSQAYDWAMRTRTELACLTGQAIALIGLTLLDVFAEGILPDNAAEILSRIRPVMTLPVLLLVLMALIAAIRFPLTGEHMTKLDRYIHLTERGEENSALKEQLEQAVFRRSLKHYGIRIVIHVLRPLYWYRLCGRERVHLDPENSAVFVCNHGEIYGPVASVLFIPYPIRPWVTSEIVDQEKIAQYLYENTFAPKRWIPKGLRRGISFHLAAPILSWMIRSLEPIPVFHGDAAQLRKTFRSTVDAMEAGDNILLFPENSANSDTKHYVREGISDFFTGFTIIGQLYYRRTGKRCQFIPVYCNKNKRTVTFGNGTSYDPDRSPAEEGERLTRFLQDEIRKLS